MKHLFLSASLFGPFAVFAQGEPPTSLGTPITTIAGFYTIACHAVNWMFSFVMLAAVIALIYAGLRFMTSAGSDDGIASARRYFVYAIVGVMVAILARSFILTSANFIGADISTAIACF